MPQDSEWFHVDELKWNAKAEVQVKVGAKKFADLKSFLEEQLGWEIGPLNNPCPVPPNDGCRREITAVRAMDDGVHVKLTSGEEKTLKEFLETSTPEA